MEALLPEPFSLELILTRLEDIPEDIAKKFPQESSEDCPFCRGQVMCVSASQDDLRQKPGVRSHHF